MAHRGVAKPAYRARPGTERPLVEIQPPRPFFALVVKRRSRDPAKVQSEVRFLPRAPRPLMLIENSSDHHLWSLRLKASQRPLLHWCSSTATQHIMPVLLGCSEIWYRVCLGRTRSSVRIRPPQPGRQRGCRFDSCHPYFAFASGSSPWTANPRKGVRLPPGAWCWCTSVA